jgi:hypothetical protein
MRTPDLSAVAGLDPVLIDIGASAGPPEIWNAIGRFSTYIGFDPDLRDLVDLRDERFRRAVMVNRAVTADAGRESVTFHLTRSPHCSSVLQPDTVVLDNYLFAELFTVEEKAVVPATTLDAVLGRLDLPGIDWFKTDSQGTDLSLFRSIDPEVRGRVLAVDLEPGLGDAFYRGEEVYTEVHRALKAEGFWLSDLVVRGSVRMRLATLQAVAGAEGIDPAEMERVLRPSPGWVEARYLRTLESLDEQPVGPREYLLLCAFALLDRQTGFALDVLAGLERRFGGDERSLRLRGEAMKQVQLGLREERMGRLRALPGRLARGALRRVARRLGASR